MNLASTKMVRRCRPLLGTFVEVSIEAKAENSQQIINAAFAAIEEVQALMSFHDPLSQVSMLNRLGLKEAVKVAPSVFRVLQRAQELHDLTDGIFDIAIAGQLLEQDLLPRHEFLADEKTHGTTQDIDLRRKGYVRFSKPLCIDLGGIAKGFAVDQAIDVLQEWGVAAGCVNAGGDLRCFGELSWPCGVRHPQNPGQILPVTELNNKALATSANAYGWQTQEKQGCAHIDGRTRKILQRSYSVSVRADTCMDADALTKVVLALEEDAFGLLSGLNAEGYIVYPDNQVVCSERSS